MHMDVASESWRCLLDASEVLGSFGWGSWMLGNVGPIYPIYGTTKLRALAEEEFEDPFLPSAIGNFEACDERSSVHIFTWIVDLL